MVKDVDGLVAEIARRLCARGESICSAESCTGGLIAKTFTDVAGSSDWFDRGFVTYSNEAKAEMLAVPESIIADYGAVSEPVAVAMASGALHHSRAAYSIAVTGVAGPAGGSAEKPVGTVWIAVGSEARQQAALYHFDGDRAAVRQATLRQALVDALALIPAS